MKKSLLIASGLALISALTGCNKQPEATQSGKSGSAAVGNMSDMAMPMEMKHGKSVGTVTAIDLVKGTVTLNHRDIAEFKWPAMEMGFSVKPELLEGIKVGDKVSFGIDWDGKSGTVTNITKVAH